MTINLVHYTQHQWALRKSFTEDVKNMSAILSSHIPPFQILPWIVRDGSPTTSFRWSGRSRRRWCNCDLPSAINRRKVFICDDFRIAGVVRKSLTRYLVSLSISRHTSTSRPRRPSNYFLIRNGWQDRYFFQLSTGQVIKFVKFHVNNRQPLSDGRIDGQFARVRTTLLIVHCLHPRRCSQLSKLLTDWESGEEPTWKIVSVECGREQNVECDVAERDPSRLEWAQTRSGFGRRRPLTVTCRSHVFATSLARSVELLLSLTLSPAPFRSVIVPSAQCRCYVESLRLLTYSTT